MDGSFFNFNKRKDEEGIGANKFYTMEHNNIFHEQQIDLVSELLLISNNTTTGSLPCCVLQQESIKYDSSDENGDENENDVGRGLLAPKILSYDSFGQCLKLHKEWLRNTIKNFTIRIRSENKNNIEVKKKNDQSDDDDDDDNDDDDDDEGGGGGQGLEEHQDGKVEAPASGAGGERKRRGRRRKGRSRPGSAHPDSPVTAAADSTDPDDPQPPAINDAVQLLVQNSRLLRSGYQLQCFASGRVLFCDTNGGQRWL